MKQELRFLQLCCQDSSLLGCYATQTGKYKSCAKSTATQFFLLIVNLLHISFNILIQQLDVCNTRLIFLHNLHQLQQPCTSRKQEHLSSSCTSLNSVFMATSTLLQEHHHHHSQTFSQGRHLVRAPKRHNSQEARSGLFGGQGRTVQDL